MTVYVDSAGIHYNSMQMCHMVADSHEELVTMAANIGLRAKWIQHEGEYNEHFDVCKSKRALAVAAGAKEITGTELALFLRARMDQDAAK